MLLLKENILKGKFLMIIIKKIMIQKARDKFYYRKKYKEVVHRFQIKYKMAVDVDMVKKKIRFLDDTVINLGEKLQTLNDRIEKYFTKQEEVVN